jgi:23S rRNA pseudouridine1911/1915/1917 synthase
VDGSRRLAWNVEAPGRLDAFLSGALGVEASRSQVQGWIREGRVQVGGAAIRKTSHKLRGGEEVEIELPPPPPPPGPLQPEDLPLTILFQDEHLLVIDKPAGLSVHPGAGQRDGTLVNVLLHHSPGALSGIGGEERPGIVHRLDKDTTGVMVVARSDRAHRELARQFHDREVSKRYLALSDGLPREREGVIDAPLGRHPKDRKRQAVVELAKGRAASTRYVVRESHGRYGLIRCEPKTGRTHQIRVHLQSVGAPLLADKSYGRGRPERCTTADLGLSGEERVLLDRHALHAARLEFSHPLSGERLAFEAALPDDMAETLEAMRSLSGA